MLLTHNARLLFYAVCMDTIARKNEKCRTCGKEFSQDEVIRVVGRNLDCKDSHSCIMRFLEKRGRHGRAKMLENLVSV